MKSWIENEERTGPPFGVPELSSIARGAGLIVFGTAVGALFRYLFQLVIARFLGPGLFGTFFLGFSVFRIAAMAAECGLPNGLVRYVALYHADSDQRRIKGVIFASARIVLVAGLLLSGLLVGFSGLISLKLFHNVGTVNSLVPFALILPVAALTSIFTSAAQGFKIMRVKVIVLEIFEPLTRLLLVLGLWMMGLRLGGVMISYGAATMAGALLSWHLLKRIFPPLTNSSIKPVCETSKLLSFSWPLLSLNFFGILLLWTDTLMLGYFRPAEDVGVYSAVQRTVLVGTVIIISFSTIFAPYISQLHSQHAHRLLKNLFQTITKWILTFSLPIYVAMIFFARPVLSLFGPEFGRGALALGILSGGWLVHASTGPLGVMITMTGRPIINFYCAGGMLFVNIALNLFLIPKYGILGAALATTFSVIAGNLINLVVVHRLLHMVPYRLDFLKPLSAGLMATGILFVLRGTCFRAPSGLLMIAAFLIFLLVYTIFLLLLRLSDEDKATFAHLKKNALKK